MRRPTGDELLPAAWALTAAALVAAQLRAGRPLQAVRVPPPPAARPEQTRAVRSTLARSGARCLVRSLVLQRWHGALGEPLDVVVGVRGGERFDAHAWLEGDPSGAGFSELHRRPANGRP